MVICLERGADLHMAQLMPLPLTVSCFSKIQIGFTFLVPAHPGSPGQTAVKRVCVCVCVQMHRRSKAMAAGVEVGDILLAVNGHPCHQWTIDQAMDAINNSAPSRDVTLHLLR